ncbi:hypothetical protein D5S18_07815 [Nocardia panacis]|uniref:Uncharacterized protein n=1 Tax=Nocardia panacis TaxID=2340916 RepID=A0A3A4L536_9NOCA|nr:hypothetical protein [Nocardia panacis]RJO77631.1 hypothetical protein D5S18_07815 [Nocardia panacis]
MVVDTTTRATERTPRGVLCRFCKDRVAGYEGSYGDDRPLMVGCRCRPADIVDWAPESRGQPLHVRFPGDQRHHSNGWWIITREGKGDWLRFGPRGGLLYRTRETEPVGTIHIDESAEACADPYFSWSFTGACGCGHGHIPEYRIEPFATASEAIEAAAFHFII